MGKFIKLGVIFGLAVFAGLSFSANNTTGSESLELASENKRVQREPQLPSSKVQSQKAKTEEETWNRLLESDPANKQKYDLGLVEVAKAWQLHDNKGDNNLTVCVIDTGIDAKHPDLKNNLALNEGESCFQGGKRVFCEKSKNGVDDDGNGFVDDVYGYDFAFESGDVSDHHGHGTHIAGSIAAESANKIGISGIAPNVKLIIAKYYDPKAPAHNNLLNTVRAIRYCTQRGADIINYSGGGLEPSEVEKRAIEEARDAQGRPILFIAAAGNERSNSDYKKYYPADYDLPNIISVTAIDKNREVLESSNYGSKSVDIAAPGKNIYSTLPGNKYGYMTGTSQATAIVTGAAALMKTKFPDHSASEIINNLVESGDFNPEKLKGKTNRQKTLNIYRALAILGDGLNAQGQKVANTMNLQKTSFSIGGSSTSQPTLNFDRGQLAELLKQAERDLATRRNQVADSL